MLTAAPPPRSSPSPASKRASTMLESAGLLAASMRPSVRSHHRKAGMCRSSPCKNPAMLAGVVDGMVDHHVVRACDPPTIHRVRCGAWPAATARRSTVTDTPSSCTTSSPRGRSPLPASAAASWPRSAPSLARRRRARRAPPSACPTMYPLSVAPTSQRPTAIKTPAMSTTSTTDTQSVVDTPGTSQMASMKTANWPSRPSSMASTRLPRDANRRSRGPIRVSTTSTPRTMSRTGSSPSTLAPSTRAKLMPTATAVTSTDHKPSSTSRNTGLAHERVSCSSYGSVQRGAGVGAAGSEPMAAILAERSENAEMKPE